MVECMSVVVNVMLSLLGPYLVQPISTQGGEIMYVGWIWTRGEIGFLNCDVICRFERSWWSFLKCVCVWLGAA